MADETFGQAMMRKLRDLDAENRRKDDEIARLKRVIERLKSQGESDWPRTWPRPLKPRWRLECEA